MAGEIEEPFRLSFQADLLHSGSISFGRFESESLSWERRSIFSHNRYLEEVEKYSKPGSVTEKKAYFEAEFKRKALLKQRALECQDGGEFPTVGNDELNDFEEYGNSNESESPCSSNPSKCNTETEVQHHDKGDVACFDESSSALNSGYDEDTISQHFESQTYEIHSVTTQEELVETHQSENDNVAADTDEQSIGLTIIDHVEPLDVSSEANGNSSLACQLPEKDHDSVSSAPRTTFSPKVKPTAETKLTRPTIKTQVNVDRSQKQVLNGASKGLMKPRTSESKGLLAKKTEKKSTRPASPLIGSGVKSLKAEVLRSEKAVKVNAQTVNRSKPSVHPSKTHIVQSATGFSFKTDQRAENRKEFYTKVAEKTHAKEVEINQVEAKTMEKQAAEMKHFRKSLNFKAKPLPSFYNESARGSDQHKVTPISNTPNPPRPRSQAMATRPDKNPLKSSVPLAIRPSSSTSSTNRIRVSESVGRNQVPEKNPFKSPVPVNIRPSSSTLSTNRIRLYESVGRNQVPEKNPVKSSGPNIRPSSSNSSINRIRVSESVGGNQVLERNPFKSSDPNIRSSSSNSLINRIRVSESVGGNQVPKRIPFKSPGPNIRPSSSNSSINRIRVSESVGRNQVPERNPSKSSVSSYIRPSSSNSSTNRIRVSESVGRNHVPERNQFKSPVPSNIRPSSSASSTNRIRVSESVGKNQVPERNVFKSSVPSNIRPSSSASSTNRMRVSESVGRNHVAEKKDKEKGKDTQLNRQKDPEPRGRDMLKKHAKGFHTWNGPKLGIVS